MSIEWVFGVQPEAGVASPARRVSLAELGLRERSDLQEWVRANPQVLGPDVLIVTFEFDAWQSSRGERERDRLDLLGLDSTGRLVVAELKRDIAPDTIEMQAIKYAAFASRFDLETLAEHHAAYLRRCGELDATSEDALTRLEEHVDEALDPEQLRECRIVLLAAGFSPVVTASAVWLTEQGVNITLVEFSAYRTEHDLVLTVSQVWPLRDAEDFTVSPVRSARRAAEVRQERRRETNAVTRLVDDDVLPAGTRLHFQPYRGLTDAELSRLRAWFEENPDRSIASWTNDATRPLRWEIDRDAYSPTGLALRILDEGAGRVPVSLAGPRWWVNDEGASLAELAGFPIRERRDWSTLHAALRMLRQGEWTTYGDLANLIDSSARAVGGHVRSCSECPNAYRVLTASGEVAANFAWTDPSERRSPRTVLEDEGVKFEAERANRTQRVDDAEFRRRMTGAEASAPG